MKFKLFSLGLILLIALILRVYQLNKVPIELFGDEIDVGIQAYSILKTGKDYLGNSFPVMFQSFDESRLPLLIYSAVPSVALFGLNEWGVRLPSVFFGMLSLIGIYLLTRQLFNSKTALFALILLAISPWHLQISRQANDATVILPVMLFAIWFFLLGLKRYLLLIISAILFALTFYTYAIAAIFTPLIVICLSILFYRQFLKLGLLKITMVLLVGFIILLPYLSLYVSGKASTRFSTISVSSDKGINDKIFTYRRRADSSFTPLIYNKPSVYSDEIIKNYLKAFSSEFLFVIGDPNLRHSVGGLGEFYLFTLAGLILGIFFIVNNFNGKYKTSFKILAVCLILAPVPASLTRDGGYHAPRLFLLLPFLVIIISLGINYLTGLKRNIFIKGLYLLTGFLIVVNLIGYFYRYYIEWSKDSWRFWQLGYKEALTYLKENDLKYSKIYINNTYETALPRFLFWYNYDPVRFQQVYQGNKTKADIVDGFEGFKFDDKYYFGTKTDKRIEDLIGENEVYLVSYRDETGLTDWRKQPPNGLKVLKTITNPFDQPIFFIVTKGTTPDKNE